MGVIDGLSAAREAAAGSPTLVGAGARSANGLGAVHVVEDDTGAKRGRRALYLTFGAGAAIGAVVAVLVTTFGTRIESPSIEVAASKAPAVTRAAPLPAPESAVQVALLPDAERILQARGVRVVVIPAEDARALRLVQGPQAFRVAGVASGVSAVAPDDIIVGACTVAPAAAGETLDVCVVRDGKLVVARL